MELTERVQEVLDMIRPFIQRDGGDVLLHSVEDGIVYVQLVGACRGCPSSTITLKMGIERAIFEEIPEITAVEQIFE